MKMILYPSVLEDRERLRREQEPYGRDKCIENRIAHADKEQRRRRDDVRDRADGNDSERAYLPRLVDLDATVPSFDLRQSFLDALNAFVHMMTVYQINRGQDSNLRYPR